MVNITNITSTTFSIGEAQSITAPLIMFVLGISLYSLFIFRFYRFLARKDIFHLNLQKYSDNFFGFVGKFFSVLFYIIEYLIIFPLFAFFWFAVVAMILIILAEKLDIATLLMISMALVASIRVTAYYNEDLSKDLAKMFPFALLAVFLLDIANFSYDRTWNTLATIPSMWKQILYYFGFTIVLEIVLRIINGVAGLINPKKE